MRYPEDLFLMAYEDGLTGGEVFPLDIGELLAWVESRRGRPLDQADRECYGYIVQQLNACAAAGSNARTAAVPDGDARAQRLA